MTSDMIFVASAIIFCHSFPLALVRAGSILRLNLTKLFDEVFTLACVLRSATCFVGQVTLAFNFGVLQRISPSPQLPCNTLGLRFQI